MTKLHEAVETALGSDREIVVAAPGALEAINRAEIDIQIATARAYPRDEQAGITKLRASLLAHSDTAAQCFYSIPRGGKQITGPTVRFAEEAARRWTSLRTQTQIIKQDSRFVTAQSMAIDLENNVGHAIIAKRRIVIKGDDGVGITTNAAVSVAKRNAILSVVPWTWWKPVFEDCMALATGGEGMEAVREKMLVSFAEEFDVMPSQIVALCGVADVASIGERSVRMLRGLYSAIHSGETTAAAVFRRSTPSTGEDEVIDAEIVEPDEHEAKVTEALGMSGGDISDGAEEFLKSLGHVPGMDKPS